MTKIMSIEISFDPSFLFSRLIRSGCSLLACYLRPAWDRQHPGQAALGPDLLLWPAEFGTLVQCTDAQRVGWRVDRRARIDRRASITAKSVEPFGTAVAGFDVIAGLAPEEAECGGRRRYVGAEGGSTEPLTVLTMADRDRVYFDIRLINDGAAMALAVDLHPASLLRKCCPVPVLGLLLRVP